MFDNDALKVIIAAYKKDFARVRKEEDYKWKSVNIFQKYWDERAEDFPTMLKSVLKTAANLLDSQSHFPKRMICKMAEKEPEAVRTMFIALFDESRPVIERIASFTESAKKLCKKCDNDDGSWREDHQSKNAISVYLFFKYPTKYYIFKYTKFREFAAKIFYSDPPKRGEIENVQRYFNMCNEIMQTIKQDDELIDKVTKSLGPEDYPDNDLHVLADNVVLFGSRLEDGKPADISCEQDSPVNLPSRQCETYTKGDFLGEVYLLEKDYDSLTSLLKHKKNIILQGATGVGKTFAAKRLAYAMLGQKDEDKIKAVQFHQSYSYEEFVMGYKPDPAGGFELKAGIFYQFCKQAENTPDAEFFLIIDEINRGNLSKIFGELLMMIERDYRGEKIAMAYDGQAFSVPSNLYVIGMMNTADRSLAMIDFALRRRFSFFNIKPAFDSEGFKDYQRSLENKQFDELIDVVTSLNQDIMKDDSLGDGFCIGHSYFCGQKKETCAEEWLSEIIEYDLIPTINEYWFDNKNKAAEWEKALKDVLHD